MATAVQEIPAAISGQSSTTDLARHVMESPHKGAGMFFANCSHGIPIQLGSVGITVGLLSAGNIGIYSAGAAPIIVPVALSVGALGVSIGGAWNIRAGNLIAGTIGALYGVFFLSLALVMLLSAGPILSAVGPGPFGEAMGTYLMLWAIISAGLTAATYFVNRSILAHQAGVTLTFLCLSIADLRIPNGEMWQHLAGASGLFVAALSFYIVTAFAVNDTAGKDVMPLP